MPRSFASLLFFFLINHLCILEAVLYQFGITERKHSHISNDRAINIETIGLICDISRLINTLYLCFLHVKTRAQFELFVFLFDSLINLHDSEYNNQYTNCVRNMIFLLHCHAKRSFLFLSFFHRIVSSKIGTNNALITQEGNY
jgi:hypothetical protein